MYIIRIYIYRNRIYIYSFIYIYIFMYMCQHILIYQTLFPSISQFSHPMWDLLRQDALGWHHPRWRGCLHWNCRAGCPR